MSKARKPETVSVSLYNYLNSSHGHRYQGGHGGGKEKGRGRVEGSGKGEERERSVYRKNLTLMKECARPNTTRKTCKRGLTKRALDAHSKHAERMKKARDRSNSSNKSFTRTPRTSRICNKSMLNTSRDKLPKNLASPKASNPTVPSTPKFYASKSESLFKVPSSIRSGNETKDESRDHISSSRVSNFIKKEEEVKESDHLHGYILSIEKPNRQFENQDESPIDFKKLFSNNQNRYGQEEEQESQEQVVNDMNEETSSCESIPEEFQHSPTVPNSPEDTQRETHRATNGLRQPSPDEFEEPKFSTNKESGLSETHEELFSPNFDTEKERIKNMMKNCASTKNFKNPPGLCSDAFSGDVDKMKECESVRNKKQKQLTYFSNKKTTSPFKFNSKTSKFSPFRSQKCKKPTSSKKSSNRYNSNSFTAVSNTGVRKENQIYARSLQEFVDSNISCINSLVEYKQKSNHEVIKVNTMVKNERNKLEYERKRQVQIKSEIKCTIGNNELVQRQNDAMREKIAKIRKKTVEKEQVYIQKLGKVEGVCMQKRQEVSDTFTEISQIKESMYHTEKESKAIVKRLQCDILEAEKTLSKLNENYKIAKHYEASRLQILRDKQKVLSDVICKDSYQFF